MTWNLGTTNQEHLDEHNLFDHAGIATPTPGKVLGESGGKYTQIDPPASHAEDHQTRHQSGGADALVGTIDATARTQVRKNSTGSSFARRRLNFIEGANVTITVADDSNNEEVDVTIASSGGGGGGGDSVYYQTTNFTITANGIYVVNTSAGNRTVTLPLVSSLGATGMKVTVKRLGTNYVYLVTQGSDHFDLAGVTQKTLWNDDNAISVAAIPTVANTWMELGYFGAVS